MNQTAPDFVSAANPKWMTLTGWVLSVLPCLLLVFSAYMKLSANQQAVDGFAEYKTANSLMIVGVLEVAFTLVYLFPRTAVLGATLLTAYLGGATETHLRYGISMHIPILCGVAVWLGLYFRDPRVRALTPWMR
jgi:hypothetical protein